MNNTDPFNSIIQHCQVSSSQEELLKDCPFVGDESSSEEDPLEDEGFQVAGPGIVMLSVLDSSQDKDDDNSTHDVFVTPPEETLIVSSSDERPAVADWHGIDDTVIVDGGFTIGLPAVDLSRDTGIGFSDVQMAQNIGVDSEPDGVPQVGGFENELTKFRVLKRELSGTELGEEPLKKLIKLGHISPLDTESARSIGDLNLNSNMLNPPSMVQKSGQYCRKRKLEFLDDLNVSTDEAEVVNLGTEESGGKIVVVSASEGTDIDLKRCENDVDRRVADDLQCNCEEDLASKETEVIVKDAESNEDRIHCDDEGDSGSKANTEMVNDIEEEEGDRYLADKSIGSPSTEKKKKGMDYVEIFRKDPSSTPSSIPGAGENTVRLEESGSWFIKNVMHTVLDILKIIGKAEGSHFGYENVSILDVARSRGMKFPRPRWWSDDETVEESSVNKN